VGEEQVRVKQGPEGVKQDPVEVVGTVLAHEKAAEAVARAVGKSVVAE